MSTRPTSFKVNGLFASIMPRITPVESAGEKYNTKKYKKKSIPKALKEQVWLQKMGKVFESKCPIVWCENRINSFDFHTGHNIPESKGGKTTIDNLIPICDRCNTSMGDRFTIDDWNKLGPGSAKAHREDSVQTYRSAKAHEIAHQIGKAHTLAIARSKEKVKVKGPWWCCYANPK